MPTPWKSKAGVPGRRAVDGERRRMQALWSEKDGGSSYHHDG